MNIIEILCKKYRATILMLIFSILYSIKAYINIPKESTPEVKVPVVYVAVVLKGASPEDIDRMIVKLIEPKLMAISGIKNVESESGLGYASIKSEFEAGFDTEIALKKVRDKIQEIRSKLPKDIEEPIIKEIDFSRFPVLYVMLYGDVSKKKLISDARSLRTAIESVNNVLEVKLSGDQEDVVEIIPDNARMQLYNISISEISAAVSKNNVLMPLGKISNDVSSFSVKIIGLLKNIDDIKNIPIKNIKGDIIRIKDIGNVVHSYRDNQNIARVNGQDAVVIEVSKRQGTNGIETIQAVRDVIEKNKNNIDKNIKIEFSRDVSKDIINSIEELQNSILLASILVILVIIVFIGKKQSLIVSLSIPISFLLTIGTIYSLGYTLNMVLLFGLILATGMIVDASIIVVEYADNLIKDGFKIKDAYIKSAVRMAIPVLSATVGIIVVYLPLLLWPGIVGKFMKYIPIALITVLSYSIVCALILVPVISFFIEKTRLRNISSDTNSVFIDKISARYIIILEKVLNSPRKFVQIVCYSVLGIFVIYGIFGHGTEFFPAAEPKNINITVTSSSNISTEQKIEISKKIENIILNSKVADDIYIYYSKVVVRDRMFGDNIINITDIELKDWDKRRKAVKIIKDIRFLLKDIHGVEIKVDKERSGPASDKPIKIELLSSRYDLLNKYGEIVTNIMHDIGGINDIESSGSSNKTEFVIDFDKNMGMLYNLSLSDMYSSLATMTDGYIVGKYKPDNAKDDVDIIIKQPKENRKITSLYNATIQSNINNRVESIDINKIAQIKAQKEMIYIKKINGMYSNVISANLNDGVMPDSKIKQIKKEFNKIKDNHDVILQFAGNTKSQKETGDFLLNAFSAAIFIKFMILVMQYNSIYYALLTLSTVVLSVSGILVMLLVTFKSFSVVMCGLGIISVAGVVVSNNIIFIDTFQELINKHKMDIKDAIMQTATLRLRPILATAVTSIMGLVTMIFNISIDFFRFKITINSPSGQWWEQLSATIAGGLLVSTILTLTFTPAMLMIKAPKDVDE